MGALGGPAGDFYRWPYSHYPRVEKKKNKPEAVSEALRINPEIAFKLAELESNQKVKLEELAVSVAIKEYDSITQNMSDVNKTMQEETKSEHFLSYSLEAFDWYCCGLNVAISSIIVLVAYIASMSGHSEMLNSFTYGIRGTSSN